MSKEEDVGKDRKDWERLWPGWFVCERAVSTLSSQGAEDDSQVASEGQARKGLQQ